MPLAPPMFQPPFASPYGYMANMQPTFPFSKFSSQYQPPTPSEYPAEEPAADFSATNSESSYMTPSSPPSYMPPNPQASYTSPSTGYMPPNPSSYNSPGLSYMPSTLPSSYPSPSYTAPNQQYNYFTPSLQPSYASSPPSIFASPSSPSYFTPSPQSIITPTLPSYTPTTTQSATVTPTSQTSYTAPSSQPAVQPQSPQAYVNPYTIPQALSPSGYPANQTPIVPTQQQVLPALPTTSGIYSADNSTIVPVVPGIITSENATQINSTMALLAPVNQSPNDLSPNAALSNPPQAAADETAVINSNGETSTDMNSLPPQVKEFIDMIPNILAMPDSQAMASNDQMQPPAEGRPRPSPFSLHKPPKKLPLHKRKLFSPPSSYYPPSYPAPGYLPPGYPASPYHSPQYQPRLPLSVPTY